MLTVSSFKIDAKLLLSSGFIPHVTICDELIECAASPIVIHFIPDAIVIEDKYPETIMFCSGASKIVINQVKEIEILDSPEYIFQIKCGFLRKLQKTIRVYFTRPE